jgi:hypothetical protein
MFGWHLALYCAFVAVFCIFGGRIGLRIFTLNSYSLQASVCVGGVIAHLLPPTASQMSAGGPLEGRCSHPCIAKALLR